MIPAPALTLPPDLSSVRAARAFVDAHCRAAGVGPDAGEEARLLVSELVTNAVLHGRSQMCVEVLVRRGVLRVLVSDENSRRPQQVDDDPEALDGRGLRLVRALAQDWGVEPRPIGKAVWFELAVR